VLPPRVEPDEFEGTAWIGITPFRAAGTRLRFTLPIPFLSSFPELNVRTYVAHGDRPGIWFFSLDAASTLAVEGAKRLYKLPYHRAQMSCTRAGDRVRYESARPGAAFSGSYRAGGEASPPAPGTLEHFLTERYCLYAVHGDRMLRAEIHHPPWPLQRAEAEIARNTMAAPLGLRLAGEPLLHYAARQDVVIWAPAQV